MRFVNLLILLISIALQAQSQETGRLSDSAHYPYWIDMMANPEVNFFQTQRAFELYWQNRAIERGSGYKPFKRWEYNLSQIVEDDGTIPAPGVLEQRVRDYISAYHTSNNPGGAQGIDVSGGQPGSGTAQCLTNGNWLEIGPWVLAGNRTSQPNGLGRINAVAFHPHDSNILYVGAPAGGMWMSTDFGKSWKSNTDTLVTLGVSAIAIHPVHPDTIYLGTGDRDASDSYGQGVIRSLDGGQTWTVSNTGMGNTVVGHLVIHPGNPALILAATNGGIYRSTNHGSNWTRTQTGNFKDLAIHSSNPNILFACSYNSARLYRSTDAGLNWTEISNGIPNNKYRMAVALTPADTNFVYVVVTNQRTFEGCYLSTDQGLSFKRMSNTPNIMDYSHLGSGTSGQAWYDLDIAADPLNKTHVFVGGVNIFKSTDSGSSWKINAHWVGTGAPAIHADQHILEFQPGTGNLFVGNDGGIYFSRNGGNIWSDISTGIGIAQIYRLSQSATDRDLLINGYQDNGTGLFEQGKWFTVMGGDGMDCAINPSNPKYAYSDLYYGDVRRYTNGSYSGKIAAQGSNGITESGGWVTPFILQEGNPGTMFIGYKNVWRSTNIESASTSAVSWTKISDSLASSNSQNILFLENSPADPNLLYMSRADNKLFLSTNVNAAIPTWVNLSSTLPNNSDVDWIESHPRQKSRVWICQSNKVYKSDDFGSSWANISSGLPNIPILCLVFDSSSSKQGLYAGTYMGVFYRDTTMSQWIWYNEGLPVQTRVRDIEIYYDSSGRDKSHVVAATYGRGNWRSPLYDEEQLPPVADFASSGMEICANEQLNFRDISLRTPTRWLWNFNPSTVTFMDGTDSNSQHVTVRFNAKGQYTVKLVVDNCAGIDSLIRVNYIYVSDPVTPANCEGKSSSIGNYGIGIFKVEVDTFTHSSLSAYEEGAYLDLACTEVMHLKTDTTYAVQITTGISYNENVKIYIDFNNNGDLSDTGEMVYSGIKQKTVHTDSIRIPASAATGSILRMRVMSDYDTIPDNPCKILRYGQTEDYGVILESRLPLADFAVPFNRICLGEDLTVLDSSSGKIYDYFWKIENGSWSDSSRKPGHQIFMPPLAGYYKVSLYLNGGGVVKSVDSAVYVSDKPDLHLQLISGDSSGCEGRDLRLQVSDSKSLAPKYTWWKYSSLPGTPLVLNDTSQMAQLSNIVLSDSGYYLVTADFQGCSDTSNTIHLSVFPTPTVNWTSSDSVVCFAGHLIQFNSTGSIAFGTLNHYWNLGSDGEAFGGSTSHTFSSPGSYAVLHRIHSDRGCSDSLTKQIVVLENPLAAFSADKDSQCLKGNEFNFNNLTTISNGGFSASWIFGDGQISGNLTPTHIYGSAGLYRVQLISVSALGCADTAWSDVRIHPSIDSDFRIVNQALNSSTCLKMNLFDFESRSTLATGNIVQRVFFDGSGSSSTSNPWRNHHYSSTGSFRPFLVEESDKGCRDTLFLPALNIYPDPVASIFIGDSIQCLGSNSFTWSNLSSISSGTIANYAWDFGDGTKSLLQNPPAVIYSSSGTYQVSLLVESDLGCTDTAYAISEVRESPIADFSAEAVCHGQSTIFNNLTQISMGNVSRYVWQLGDGNGSSAESPQHIYLQPGSYTVLLKAESDQGCSDSISKSGILVHANPKAGFKQEKVRSWENETDIQFTDLSSSDVNSRSWFFEGHGVSDESNPLVTFIDTGSFFIRLTVQNAEACTDSSSMRLFIFPEVELYIPTAFSPNLDQRNELFRISGLSYASEFNLRIYNRWGQLVYQSDDIGEGWNGSYLDVPAAPGNYAYVLELKDLKGMKSSHRGMFSLIR